MSKSTYIRYPTGSYYNGEVKGLSKHERHGQGKMTFHNGNVYEGTYINNMQNGYGIMRYSDGGLYKGEWKNDNRHGYGTMKYRDGDVYQGHWKNDKRDGTGIIKVDGVGIYEGQWENDMQQGNGKMIYASKAFYEGQWKNGEPHGQGRMIFPDGGIYEGQWKNGAPHGPGRMKYPGGGIYEGQWVDFTRVGNGIMEYANRDVYEGQWDNNRQTGEGIMIYVNGDVYEGHWENNIRHGQGIMRYADGTVSEGIWDNGEIVQGPRPGVAYEIHNAADNINMDKYYELLQIDVPDEYYTDIDMIEYIKGQFINIIREKMPDKEAILDAILTKANNIINENKVFVGRTVDYVMKQPDDFKELYIESFIIDCSQAYEGEHQMSCNKGILERINISLIPPLTAISSDCDETDEDCIKYKNLLRLLTQSINIQDITKEWSEKPDIQGMSAQERKEDFITFITSKYVELGMTPPTEIIQKTADDLDYVYETLEFGGGRGKHTKKRKTHITKRKINKHKQEGNTKKNKKLLIF